MRTPARRPRGGDFIRGGPLFLVTAETMEALRAHARTAAPGHEVGGRLHVAERDGLPAIVNRFEPLENLETEPGLFRPPPAEHAPGSVPIHTHPGGADYLSPEDIEAAVVRGEPLTAIFVPASDLVCVWRVTSQGSCQPVRVAIEGR